MRGLAVLVMIEAHVIDSWTRLDARHTWQFMWAMILGGFGAPLFLFLAGLSVALSAGSKLRRTGDAAAAARSVMRRGIWVFGLAFLFRVQAWVLGMGSPRTLLKVDILNIMGPSIVVAAALWGACRTERSRVAAFTIATLAVGLFTPVVRHTPLLDRWPDALVAVPPSRWPAARVSASSHGRGSCSPERCSRRAASRRRRHVRQRRG